MNFTDHSSILAVKWEMTDIEQDVEAPTADAQKVKLPSRQVKARMSIQDLPDDESSSDQTSGDEDYVDEYRRAKRNQRTVSLHHLNERYAKV